MFQRPETFATSTLIALAARMSVFQCAVSSLFFSMCLQCAVHSLFFFSQCVISLFLPKIPRMRAMTINDIDVYPVRLEMDMKLMNAAPVCHENE